MAVLTLIGGCHILVPKVRGSLHCRNVLLLLCVASQIAWSRLTAVEGLWCLFRGSSGDVGGGCAPPLASRSSSCNSTLQRQRRRSYAWDAGCKKETHCAGRLLEYAHVTTGAPLIGAVPPPMAAPRYTTTPPPPHPTDARLAR